MKSRILLLCFLALSIAATPMTYAARKISPVPARTNAATRDAQPSRYWKDRFNMAAIQMVTKLARVMPNPVLDEDHPEAPYNDLAIAALCCGVGGWLIPLALPAAIVMGIIALNQIRISGERGRGMAIAGIVLGLLPFALLILLVVWLTR